MQWVGLVEGPGHVCCRYRLAAYRPAWEAAGHSVQLLPMPHGWWERVQLFRSLHGANVILQRRLLPGWQLRLLRGAARRLVFDFDDAVFLRDSYSPRGLHSAARLRRFAATVAACDAVVAGNDFLREQAAHFCGTRPVHAIPTCLDPPRYPLAAHARAGDKTELVWIGSSSTLQGLERVGPLLDELGQGLPGLRLKLVCDRFASWNHLPVVACPWSEQTEAAELAAADVGISWVPDDDWSRGKCGLKVLQYMAAGLPVVANPVGVHRDLVRPGETGFLAETPAQWVEAVGWLAHDPGLRRQMGLAGRGLVEAGYGVAQGAARWLELFARLEGAAAPQPLLRPAATPSPGGRRKRPRGAAAPPGSPATPPASGRGG
jgi:glycosyltransferase involved in cell wall biosynthesis